MIKEAFLYSALEGGAVQCRLCAHRCVVQASRSGICGVRQNINGALKTLVYGDVIASHADPVEKKPFFHFLPGSTSYSIATVGCNFKCSFCQNWQISQASRREGAGGGYELKPEEVVREAKKLKCRSISYTYTEPTVFFEYACDTAKLAKREGLYNAFVTNGFMSGEALDMIRPYLDACNVDLKSFSDDFYGKICGARLGPVLDSIKYMRKLGIWVEVTTLVVPGENDSDTELKAIADFLASVDRGMPWHVSRFHPDYRMTAPAPTAVETLRKAARFGKMAGLKYVYAGNVPGEAENTYCHGCGELLVERYGFSVSKNAIDRSRCPACDTPVEGVFK